MRATNVIEGLQIIQRSKPEAESDFHIRAEHDNIYAGSLDWPMPEADKTRLEELGWHFDDDVDGFRALM